MNILKNLNLKGVHLGSGQIQMLWAVSLFAFGHTIIKWLSHIPFYQLAFLRAVVTIVICLFVLKNRKISSIGNNKTILIWRGLTGTLALVCYFYSLQHMPLASAVTIQYLAPVMTLIVAHFWLKEKSNSRQWWSILLAFAGILLAKGFDSRVSTLELIVSLISVFSAAIAYNLVRLSRKYDHELVVVLYFPLVAVVILGPVAIYNWVWPTGIDWVYILIMGVFTQLAQMYMTIAYHRAKASDVTVFNFLGVVFSFVLGYWFFNETFDPISFLGLSIVVAAVFLNRKPKLAS